MEEDESSFSEDQALGEYAKNPAAADVGDDIDTWDRARMMAAEDREMQARQMMTEDTIKEATDLPGGHAEPPPFDPADWTVNEEE
jgi:hypothetical protein